jgi:hypothetical protein
MNKSKTISVKPVPPKTSKSTSGPRATKIKEAQKLANTKFKKLAALNPFPVASQNDTPALIANGFVQKCNM